MTTREQWKLVGRTRDNYYLYFNTDVQFDFHEPKYWVWIPVSAFIGSN